MSNTTRSTSNSSSSSTSGGGSGSYDERFVVPLEASRRGAHRARVSPVMAALPVVAVVGIVVGAIALVYVLFGGLGGGSDTTAQPTPSSTAAPASTGAQQAAAPSPSPSDGATGATPTSVVAGTVDKTIPVTVFNGSGRSGLGRRAGDKLTAGGWKVGSPQTWTGAPVQVTTVYYGSDDQRASAMAIVKLLKRGTARMSPAVAKAGITVVVGPDYLGGTGQTSSSRTRTSRSGATGTHSAGDTTKPGDTKTTAPSGTKPPTDPAPSPQDPTAPAAGGSTPTPSAT